MRPAIFTLFAILLSSHFASAQCDVDVEVPADITICIEDEVNLDGIINGTESCFNWVSDQGYFNDSDISPFVFVDQNTIFTFTAIGSVPGSNLITNGDFEGGDDGSFTTDYEQASATCVHSAGFLGCEGVYEIMDDPSFGHTDFEPCAPMGSQQMVVNGAASLQQIWCQDVDVVENQKYEFSAWAQSVNSTSPAQLQFAIDGIQIGNILSLSGATCAWEEIKEYWLSTTTGTIEICVTNQNTAADGNDFAIDDIFFGELCSDIMEFNVTVGDLEINPTLPLEFDCNTPDIELSVNAFSSDTPLTYDWTSPDFNIINADNDGNAVVFIPGTYVVTVTDAIGCTIEHFFDTEGDIEPPEINLEPSNPILLCGDNTVSIFNNDDQASYDYYWEWSQAFYSAESILEAADAGEYTLTVTDENNGCTSTASIIVTVDDNVPDIEADFSNPIDCNNTLSELILVTTETLTSIEWYDEDGNIVTDLKVSEGGLYTVSVVSENGCIADDFVVIPELVFDPQLTINLPNTIDCNNPTANLSVNVMGNFNLDWSGPNMYTESGNNLPVSIAGIYTLIVSDNGDCSVDFQVEIIADLEEPLIELAPVASLDCDVVSVPITVNNFDIINQYDWTLPNTMTATGQSITATIPGEYTLSVTGPNGCNNDSIINVIAGGNLPTLNISADPISCSNSMTELTAMGSYNNLTWSDLDGPINDLMIQEQGWYYAFADNGNGCSLFDSIFVSVDTLIPGHLFEDQLLDCNNATAMLLNLLDDNYLYEWILPDGSQSTSDTLIASVEGIYYVTTSSNNGCSVIDSVELTSTADVPPFDVSLSDTLNCINTSITLEVIGIDIDSYNLTGPSYDESGSSSFIIENPGTYTLDLVGNNGCPVSMDITIPIDTMIVESTVDLSNIDCINDVATLSIENPIPDNSYSWTQNIVTSTQLVFETQSFDEVILTTTNQINGCVIEQFFMPEVDTITPTLSYQVAPLTCTIQEQEIFVIPTDFYQYQWLLPNGEESFQEIQIAQDTGTYELTVIGANGCTNFYEIFVDGTILLPEFEILPPTPLDCNNATTTIEVSASQPLAGFTAIHDGFSLSFGNGTLVTDQPGEWSVQATASNGCSNIVDFIIEIDTIPPDPILEIENIDCLNAIGSMTISNPELGATYTWEDEPNMGIPQEGLSFLTTSNQPITLAAIGSNGCEISTSASISIDTISPQLELTADQLSCINTTSFLQIVSPDGATEYDWYLENNFIGQNTELLSEEAGIYTVIATSLNNSCSSQQSIELFSVEMPTSFDFNLMPPLCGEEEFLLDGISVEGGSGPYIYNLNIANPNWIDDDFTSTLYEGENTIQIIDANGCILDTTLQLILTDPIEIQTNNNLTVDWGSDTTLNLVINKPIEDIESILWTPSQGLSCDDCVNPTVTLFEDQIYEILVIDINGCEETVEIRIDVIRNLNIYIPNIFTPDGLNNELFFPFATEQQIKMINNFYIFDRWGNRVFTNSNFLPNDPAAGWNGTILGADALPGVYTYVMEIIFFDDSSKVIAGDVTLLR